MVRPLLTLLISILLAGCIPSDPPDSPEAGAGKLRMALMMAQHLNGGDQVAIRSSPSNR
ncbi:MAG: hypothetical protein ACRD1R_14725 [Acidobacteriota bacterium]